MKAKELAELLLQNPDAEVKLNISFVEKDDTAPGGFVEIVDTGVVDEVFQVKGGTVIWGRGN